MSTVESPTVEYRESADGRGRWFAHIMFADGVRRWVELGGWPNTPEGRADVQRHAERWQAAELLPGMVDVSSDLLASEEQDKGKP